MVHLSALLLSARRPWRDAASAILVARNALVAGANDGDKVVSDDKNKFDYKVLMLRRSAKSAFMPNAYVFPGGVVAREDFSRRWRDLFAKNSDRDLKELEPPKRPGVVRPFLMQADEAGEPDEEGGLSREAAFRLCAVRETFEESGVFLHYPSEKHIDPALLESYRPKVHKDPRELLSLCAEAGVVPDLWSLVEFSDWLTPLGRGDEGGRRFDTVFYAAFLEGEGGRAATTDAAEVTDAVYTDPDTIMDDCREGKLWLAPPQVYELTRLSKLRSFDSLRSACQSRASRHNLPSMMPVLMKLKGKCLLSVLPGDELYPEDPDYRAERWEGEFPELDMTLDEVNARHPRMNRAALFSRTEFEVFVSPDVAEDVNL